MDNADGTDFYHQTGAFTGAPELLKSNVKLLKNEGLGITSCRSLWS